MRPAAQVAFFFSLFLFPFFFFPGVLSIGFSYYIISPLGLFLPFISIFKCHRYQTHLRFFFLFPSTWYLFTLDAMKIHSEIKKKMR